MKTKQDRNKALAEAFMPDFNEELFTVKITVYRNGTVRMLSPHGDYKPTYPEVIGAIEVAKTSFLREVGALVQEAYEKHKKADKVKK